MHVISRKPLRAFWTVHPAAERPLLQWYRTATKVTWRSVAEVRATYASADQVGRFTVFNIGGNKYRLVVAADYQRQVLFIRFIGTHSQYDAIDAEVV